MRLRPLILFVWNRCANEREKEGRKGERTLVGKHRYNDNSERKRMRGEKKRLKQ